MQVFVRWIIIRAQKTFRKSNIKMKKIFRDITSVIHWSNFSRVLYLPLNQPTSYDLSLYNMIITNVFFMIRCSLIDFSSGAAIYAYSGESAIKWVKNSI